jgi:hypothetical protein
MRLVATQKVKITYEARLVPFFRLPYALPIHEGSSLGNFFKKTPFLPQICHQFAINLPSEKSCVSDLPTLCLSKNRGFSPRRRCRWLHRLVRFRALLPNEFIVKFAFAIYYLPAARGTSLYVAAEDVKLAFPDAAIVTKLPIGSPIFFLIT